MFTSLGVTIFRFTLRDRAQVFVRKETFTWKNISYFVWRLLQRSIKDLEEWSDKYVSWQLISTLLSLMINKSVS